MDKIIFNGTFPDLTAEHRAAAKEGASVYFKAFHWADGHEIWLELCHRDKRPTVVQPLYGFDNYGFFVRPVPCMCWPKT